MIVEDANLDKNEEQTTPEYTVKVVDDGFVAPIVEEVVAPVVDEVIAPEEPEKPIEEVEEVIAPAETIEISDEKVLEYLKTKEIEVDNLDSLKNRVSKKLSPEIEKFIEFQEKTGNANYSDFLATQKDWKSENHELVLKELIKIENPTLDADDIQHLFEKKYVYDADLNDEYEIKDKKIQSKVDLQRALDVLEKRKQEYMTVKGFDENVPAEFKEAKTLIDKLRNEQVENEKIVTEKRNAFISSTDKAFEQISSEGFKVKIGENEFQLKPSDANQTKELQSDIANFQKKFFDKDGNLVDPVGYHKALYFAMNADSVAEHFLKLGEVSLAEKEERESKNIPQHQRQQVPNQRSSGITVRVVD